MSRVCHFIMQMCIFHSQFLGLLVRAKGLASEVNEAEFELSVSI